MKSNKEENQNNSQFSLSEIRDKSPRLYLILIITLILIALFIFYLIEKIIFILLTLITFTKIISLPVQILLHLLFIRYLILQVAFSGQNYLVSRSILGNLGRLQASPVYKTLNNLHDSLLILNDISTLTLNLKKLSEIKKNIGNARTMINYELDILSKIKSKFNKLTIDQEIFYNNINGLKDSINNCNISSLINDIIDKINKYKKDSLIDIPSEEKDQIISELTNMDLNIQNILLFCHNLINQIEDYLGDNYSCCNTRYIRNFLKNNIFGSIEQLHCELDNYYYYYEERTLITKDKCQIEYIILRKNSNSPRKRLMIICGPNGVPFQVFSRNFRFDNYLDMNMDVLCWNYRGYGFSKGKPSYNLLRTDILELFDEVKKNYNYEKYAVHGISIGGIPCCHLASNRKEIELMICDRNFGRLDNMTQSFPLGKFLFFIYKFFLFQSTDNVDNYLKVKCYKIILNDPKDTIVLETCSLKTLISQKLCEKYFECSNEDNSFNNSIMGTYSNNYNELESLSSKKSININKNQSIPLTTLNEKITTNNNKTNSKILDKKTVLDKIFNSVEEKKLFVNLLINISNILNKDKFEAKQNSNVISNIINKFKSNNNLYSNLKEEEVQNTSGIFDFVKFHMVDILDTVESAGDTLRTLMSLKRDYTKAVFIDNFFNNMFIWGSLYYHRNKENNIHSTKNIKKIFEDCMKLFEIFWNSQEIMSCKGLTLMKDIEVLYKYFEQIQNSLKNVGLNTKDGFVKLMNDDLIDNDDYEKCLNRINIGNFVPLKCGHNGSLSIEETELLEKYLNKSTFLKDFIEKNINEDKDQISDDNEDIKTSSHESDKNINQII